VARAWQYFRPVPAGMERRLLLVRDLQHLSKPRPEGPLATAIATRAAAAARAAANGLNRHARDNSRREQLLELVQVRDD
jgi:hypothetical protein